MTVYTISPRTSSYRESNSQMGIGPGQVGDAFRKLFEAIRDGNLTDALETYNILAHITPQLYQSLSSKLIDDYNLIGQALRAGNVPRAQAAVVHFQQSLQSIRRTNEQQQEVPQLATSQNDASYANTVFSLYNRYGKELPSIGKNIDVMA